MPGKPNTRSWNDVQTAIATAAIVAMLGLWNLFATPSEVVNAAEADNPVLPPQPTETPVEAESIPTAMHRVKIIFTPGVTPVVQQQVQQTDKKKKKKDNNNNNSGSVSVTQTKSS